MKIIQVMPEFGLAGAEIMCENLTYELRKLGHEVIVLSLYDYHSAITERLEQSGIDVRYLGKKPGLDFSIIWKIKKILKKSKADVIHTHRYCAQYAIPAAMIAGVKHRVHTIHSVAVKENEGMARKLNKFFFMYCRLVPVALSELIRDSIEIEYGIRKDKIPVIFNGIDLSKCLPKEDYSIDGNFKILHIGRFSEPKNHIGLIKAFKLFHDNHVDSELWLIGDGEKKAEIENYVTQNSLVSCVKFLGLQSDVYGYLHDADMFTLPSLYEGIPMTLIEAMGTGLPIVATAVGGVPDMMEDGKEAIFTETDSESVADSICMILDDSGLRQSLGQNALVRSRKFSAEAMAQEYLEIYQRRQTK